jgi:hypothetical protein
MQNLIYDQAPYDILYYDANLAAYRTDRFAGWQNQPPDGTPLFTYSTLQYTYLTDATAAPSAGPSAVASGLPGSAGASGGPTASAAPAGTSTSSSGPNSVLLVVAALVIVAIVGGFVLAGRRRRNAAEDE